MREGNGVEVSFRRRGGERVNAGGGEIGVDCRRKKYELVQVCSVKQRGTNLKQVAPLSVGINWA